MIAGLPITDWSILILGSSGAFAAGFFLLKTHPIPERVPRSPQPPPPPVSKRPGLPLVALWSSWRERHARERRIEASREVLPQALEIAIQALKAGQTVPQTLEYLSQESAPPLQEEFALVCREMAWGAPAEQALAGFAERVPTSDVQRFLESYRLSRQTGANLTHLLQTLLAGMEDRNRLLRRMDSMTAQARLSGILMGCLPLFLAVILSVMDPNLMTPLFTTSAGWCILIVAMLLECAGFLWIKSLMTLEG